MFFSSSPHKKLKRRIKDLINGAERVLNYRREHIPELELTAIQKHTATLKDLYKKKSFTEKNTQSPSNALQPLLKKHGGYYFPQSGIAENVETLLVASILAIGIKAYFFQTFAIPTNSMYPTFNGMTTTLYSENKELPSAAKKITNQLFFGASFYQVDSPNSGEIAIPLFDPRNSFAPPGIVAYKPIATRKWFGLLPSQKREYTLFVGNQPVSFRTPWEFREVEDLLLKAFFPEFDSFEAAFKHASTTGKVTVQDNILLVKTGKFASQNRPVLAFDINMGDVLFVDRFSYHFREPKIGEPFVFRTKHVPGKKRPDGSQEDLYYIKRLVATGENTLKIIDGVLYNNGSPLSGNVGFDNNHAKKAPYQGYENYGLLDVDRSYIVPEENFFAMGDNSYHSGDSRYWGPVPERALVGKAAFIFYPFTSRWGLTK